MRFALVILISAVAFTPQSFARARAVSHRGVPWQAPACSATAGLPSYGFLKAGALVRSIESDPRGEPFTSGLSIGGAANTVYATRTDGSILESNDAGCTWSVRASLPELLGGKNPKVLARHSSRIYVYTDTHLIRLTHGTVQTFGFPEAMQRVEVNPGSALHLRAVSLLGTSYESRNGGVSWTRLYSFSTMRVAASEFAPTDFDRILAWSLLGGRLSISRDGGASWQLIGPPWVRVDSIAISPVDPALVWVSGRDTTQASALYRSTDGGLTFKPAAYYSQQVTHSASGYLAPHPTDPNIVAVPLLTGMAIFDGVSLSYRDAGAATWEAEWSPAGVLYFVDLQFR